MSFVPFLSPFDVLQKVIHFFELLFAFGRFMGYT